MAHRTLVPPSGPSCFALCSWGLTSDVGFVTVAGSGHFTWWSTSLIEDERCVVISSESHLHVFLNHPTPAASAFSILQCNLRTPPY